MARELHAKVAPEIGRALAGVNGDFYERDNPKYAGDPRGLQLVNGELVSAPSNVCTWFDPEGNPHLEEVKGEFQITWPDGRKMSFGLNQQRRSNMAVLYTPTYGASTRIVGGQDLILEREGYAVSTYHSVAEYRAQTVRADAFLFDVRLPDGNGLDLARCFPLHLNYRMLFLKSRSAPCCRFPRPRFPI